MNGRFENGVVGVLVFSCGRLFYASGAQICQKSRRHLKNARRQKGDTSKFLTENPQLLGATMQDFVAMVTWRPEFVYACFAFFIKAEENQKSAGRVTSSLPVV